MRGKTINIFMPDSNPRGIKICDIKDSIVKAIFIPRNKIEEVSKRTDLMDPGIYFLFGNEDEIGKMEVYIGEAENLITRIKQHNANKDFWNSVICFVSEKKNINKAHIKYLENYCVQEAQRINKCKLENSVMPTQSALTESDEDFIFSFFDDLKILIAALGFPIFEESKKEQGNIFICKRKDVYAEGEYSEDGMTVFKGSKARLQASVNIGSWIKNLRSLLIERGVIKSDDKTYIFQEDYTFHSPSAAAAIVLAVNVNGWNVWKNKKGETLDEKFRKNT